MLEAIIAFMFLGLANGMISLTISKGVIFRSFRDFFFFRSQKSKFMGWMYDLVTCPYCTSHWVAFAMIGIWQPTFTDCGVKLLDLAVSAFVNVAIASYAWSIYFRITNPPTKG